MQQNSFNNQNSNYPDTRDKSFNNISAMNTFDSVPSSSNNAYEIVAVKKNHGTVTDYQLSSGKLVSKQEAIAMAKKGEIKNVGIATNQGNEYLRSLPDDQETNNIDNLPTITD